ncbi:hypothetical protein D3C75_1028970 [compost metagenome]
MLVIIHRRGVGLLVWRYHVETIGQEIGILIGHRLAGGTVDNHRIEQVALFHQADQAAQIERLFGFGQFVPPDFQRDAVHVGQHRP